MVKLENPIRKGQIKAFNEADVDAAKKLGWTEIGKPKTIKTSKASKAKGGK